MEASRKEVDRVRREQETRAVSLQEVETKLRLERTDLVFLLQTSIMWCLVSLCSLRVMYFNRLQETASRESERAHEARLRAAAAMENDRDAALDKLQKKERQLVKWQETLEGRYQELLQQSTLLDQDADSVMQESKAKQQSLAEQQRALEAEK